MPLIIGSEWLEALVMQESSGNPRATRYEPHQDRAGRTDAASDADKPGQDDGMLEDDRSYGLMQVMGYNLRRLVGVPPGTPMKFDWALDPLFNIAAGVAVLRGELAATHGDVARALARYNGGPTGDAIQADGKMRREEYVAGVRAWVGRVIADRGGNA